MKKNAKKTTTVKIPSFKQVADNYRWNKHERVWKMANAYYLSYSDDEEYKMTPAEKEQAKKYYEAIRAFAPDSYFIEIYEDFESIVENVDKKKLTPIQKRIVEYYLDAKKRFEAVMARAGMVRIA